MDTTNNPKANLAEVQFYTVDEFASVARLSSNAIYQLVARKELPAIRIGKAIRLPKTACDRIFRGEAA